MSNPDNFPEAHVQYISASGSNSTLNNSASSPQQSSLNDHEQEAFSQNYEEMEDLNEEIEEEEDLDEQDYYDPQDDLAYFHDEKMRIEESWLEWERQASVNNRQSSGFMNSYIFQKPGSRKRRERRQKAAMVQTNNASSRPDSTFSATGSGSGSGADAAIERLRRPGSYRPALASSIVHSYSNLTWEARQAAREKRLAEKAAAANGSGENLICTLPIEILSHVVSHLEPSDLLNVSLVCRLLYHVVNADSCWKAAFMKFFGASIPFKRLDPKSWRGEYIKRTRLLRRWEKGRGANIWINPKIGQVSSLWSEVNSRSNTDWFLAGSVNEGVVARCSPSLGKVQKDAVFRMAHHLHAIVSAMTMDRHRVLWGLSTGQVSLTTLSYAAAGQTFQTFAGFHTGKVSCTKLIPNSFGFVLTGGIDGIVKLWDVSKARCVREFSTGFNLAENERKTIDHICCEPSSRIIAGTSGGEIFVWEVDIHAIVTQVSASASGATSPAQSATSNTANHSTVTTSNPVISATLPKVIKLPEQFKGVRYLEVDFGMNHGGLILAQAMDSKVMHLYDLETLAHLAILKSPAHFTAISAIYWDITKEERPMITSLARIHGRNEIPSLLVSGDQAGNICLWYLSDVLKRWKFHEKRLDLHLSQGQHGPLTWEPTCVLKGHQSKVTSLFVDGLVIVSGGLDGWAKAWNPVNGQLIAVLNTGYVAGHDPNDMATTGVKCIAVNGLQCRGIMSVGRLIKSWDFSPEATQIKDKYQKSLAKRPIHYSAGPKNKIHNDIRHSLEETVSLKRLEAQAKERREQLHKRYNNLEGLNMVDMTDEEVVEYVMLLSKDEDDQEAAQLAFEMQQIQEIERQLEQENQAQMGLAKGGEGSSSSTFSSDNAWAPDEPPTAQELEEEEELVRRAIELSMLDTQPPFNPDYPHGGEHVQKEGGVSSEQLHDHSYCPIPWESSHVVDVDSLNEDEYVNQEDQRIVQSVLQELEQETNEGVKGKGIAADTWPTISQALPQILSPASPLTNGSNPTNENDRQAEATTKKMTWSMVARTNTDSLMSDLASGQTSTQHRQPTVIKQYVHGASQGEIEDEDTQLARILSLSMIEK